MNPSVVQKQIAGVIQKLIGTNVSVDQSFPTMRIGPGGAIQIGPRASSSIALRDVSYDLAYQELVSTKSYDARLVDGGLLLFQYRFDSAEVLTGHRLAYFPSPTLPSVDEAPELYEREELYGDILARKLVRFPIRCDFAPQLRREIVHPAAHMTLGQYENCRIPLAGPIAPDSFALFIIRNFYFRAYTRYKNKFDRSPVGVPGIRLQTLSETERRVTHIVPGR